MNADKRRSLRTILIANRGEIALRIMRSCRALGISPVVVYAPPDRSAPHVRQADAAVEVESYLSVEEIVAAAKRAGADAIHPGYGFLAENADFAEACEKAGIAFIGPRPEVIRRMGSKIEARKLAESVGVPVVPTAGFPLMIKAAAGGGGRGMRIVRSEAELAAAKESAAREAQKAFGDGTLLVERYIPGARHIEVQILGDLHGNLIHLYERECSIQRRHQKVIEESPSPALDTALRTRLCEAALSIGHALKYHSAGTVEFLLAASREFYFIEVNTRIQVEHPVTELRTGLDLIAMQIAIAEGQRLGSLNVQPSGHAMEARLCAEDPATGFLPATGRVEVWDPPSEVRLDTAACEGLEVGIHYDSLLGKVIAHGPDRETARRRLVDALERLAVQGVTTNREFLIRVLESAEFREGRATTEFLDTFPPVAPPDPAADFRFAAAAALHSEWRQSASRTILPNVAPSYRNNPFRDPSTAFEIGGEKWEIHWRAHGGGRYSVRSGERHAEACVVECRNDRIRLSLDGLEATYRVVQAGKVGEILYVRSPRDCRTVRRLLRHPPPESAARHETANSPMPGQVLRILVQEGQQVKAGDPLIVLEAMKMEQTIKTATGGVVDAVLVKTGDLVMPGQMLVQITAMEKADGHTNS